MVRKTLAIFSATDVDEALALGVGVVARFESQQLATIRFL